MRNILMILSAATAWTQKDGSQRPTGFWAEEFVAPHQALTAAGCAITVATPGGKPAVVDALSLSIEVNHGDAAKVAALAAYLDTQADTLRAPRPLAQIELGGFDAVFVPGGHGPMQDLAVDADAGRLLAAAIAHPGKLVAAVCHGQAALLAAGDAAAWAFRGRRLTGFSNAEETQTGLAANAPWLLEDRLRAAGAEFEAGAPWSEFVVVDGNLVTGQNPASAGAAARAVLAWLDERDAG